MSNSPMIYQKISSVMKEVGSIGKDRNNTQQGFKFRGIDDVYNHLHPKMAAHGIFTIPEVLEEKREQRTTKSGGNMTYVILRVKFTFFAEDGSSVSAVMVGEGSDSGDKASNKAQAIAHKYALLQVFAIPTEGDNDPDSHSPEFAPIKPQARPASKPSAPPKEVKAQAQAELTRKANYPANFEEPEDAGEYQVKFGKKFQHQKLNQIDRFEMDSFLQWCHKAAENAGKQLSHEAAELSHNFERYLVQNNLIPPESN